MRTVILAALLLIICLCQTAAAQDHKKFCRKFKKNLNLRECVETQKDAYYDLYSGLYDENVIDTCKNRYLLSDRVVTYVDYYRSYKCAKKEQRIYDSLQARRKKLKSTIRTN